MRPEPDSRRKEVRRCRRTSRPDASGATAFRPEVLPQEMIDQARWVLWRGKKIPFQANAPRRMASSTDPATWSSFSAAAGAYDPTRDRGVGFVLGAGFACVDIDHRRDEAAVFLLEELGCGYVEVSPSGEGLHGWALSHERLPRCKGELGGMSVEVYNGDRYMTVTGEALVAGPLIHSDRLLRLSLALEREAQRRPLSRFPESAESSESTESSENHVLAVPEDFLPARVGQRNERLFAWCRHIKTVHPTATEAERVAYARQWHAAALPYIGTKDPAASVADFLRGWGRALPTTFRVEALVERARLISVPTLIAEAVKPHLLAYQLFVALQRARPGAPVFLSTRDLGNCLGTSHPTAGSVVQVLAALGVLVMAERGTATRSPRYHVVEQTLRTPPRPR